LPTRRYKGKQRKKYTPSYEAFVFGIRGKAPRGTETGARIRPITKGFTFANNMPTSFSFGGFNSSFKMPKGKSKFNFSKIKFGKSKRRKR
jgi:hypothetical protein